MTMRMHAPIQTARLLERLEEALLLVSPDLVIRDLLSNAARELGRGPYGERKIIGSPLREAIAPLISPREMSEVLHKVIGVRDSSGEDGITLRGVEGGASAAVRAAGLTRYFDISIRRIVTEGNISLLLGIRDVTERLRLARELESARAAHEMAVAVLRTDPELLRNFLQDAASSMSLIQSLLRMPARTPNAFRDKLGRILVEARGLRERAGELGIGPIAVQAAGFEAALESLRSRDELTGDEFLPLAVQLDEIFTLITSGSQLAEQRAASSPSSARPATSALRLREVELDWPSDCGKRLEALVRRVGQEKEHLARLTLRGLDVVPECYRRNVDHMLLQLVRNAIEHGIEPEAERVAARKPAKGHITVECSRRSDTGVEISVRDDGCGFDVALIGRVAVEKGLISAEALPTTDPRALFGLIFRPGFTTEGVAGFEGKGLGMVFLRELVTRMDGHVNVATKGGRYTRFRIQLPDASGQRVRSAPAAEAGARRAS